MFNFSGRFGELPPFKDVWILYNGEKNVLSLSVSRICWTTRVHQAAVQVCPSSSRGLWPGRSAWWSVWVRTTHHKTIWRLDLNLSIILFSFFIYLETMKGNSCKNQWNIYSSSNNPRVANIAVWNAEKSSCQSSFSLEALLVDWMVVLMNLF